jgi:hypothetical protein
MYTYQVKLISDVCVSNLPLLYGVLLSLLSFGFKKNKETKNQETKQKYFFEITVKPSIYRFFDSLAPLIFSNLFYRISFTYSADSVRPLASVSAVDRSAWSTAPLLSVPLLAAAYIHSSFNPLL